MEQFRIIIITIGNTDFKITFQGRGSVFYEKWESDTHLHPFKEMHLINRGKALIRAKDEKIFLSDNYVCIMPSSCYHSIESVTPVISRMSFYIEISKNGNHCEDTYRVYNRVFNSDMPFYNESNSTYIADIFKLYSTSDSTGVISDRIRLLLSMILCDIYDENADITNDSAEYNRIDYKTKLLLDIESYIYDVMLNGKKEENEILFENLAEHICLSPTQLRRLIRKHFNCTYRSLLYEYKIERAKMLIENKDLTLEKVAEMCGYSTYAGFYKAFTRHIGTTPEKYRNRNEN